jgi:hypothetical protein
MKKDAKEKILIGLFLIGATIAGLLFVLWFNEKYIVQNKTQNETNISTSTKEQIIEMSQEVVDEINNKEKLTDFDYFTNLPKLPLATGTVSWVNADSEESKINGRVIKKFIKAEGQITNAYLFVDVSVDNGKKLKIWDSVYVSLQKFVNGHKRLPVLDGHFFKSHSLDVPASESSLYLFDLRQLPIVKKKTNPSEPVYSETRGAEYLDWLGMLKEANEFEFVTFLSTSREGGMINEISIAYECSEETPECSLEIK